VTRRRRRRRRRGRVMDPDSQPDRRGINNGAFEDPPESDGYRSYRLTDCRLSLSLSLSLFLSHFLIALNM